MPQRATAIAAATGAVLFVVLFVVGFGIQPTSAPNSGSSALKILSYVGEHRSRILVGDFLIACASLPFVLLVAALHRLMRRAEGPDGWLSTAMVVAGAIGTGAFLAAMGFLTTLAYRPVVSPGVARMLLDAGFVTLNLSGIALGAWVAAVSAAAMLHRLVPGWVGWIGVPVAALQVVGGGALARGDGAFSPQGEIPLCAAIAVAAWTLLLALGLVLATRRQGTPAAAAP
jgi:hypothetical protein